MYKLVVTKIAHDDLNRIVTYIAVHLANPTAATSFLEQVEKCYNNLKENPFMYEGCRDARLTKEGYRKASLKGYVLIYKVDEQTKKVIIYRFFYGAQDYLKLI